MDVGSKMRFVDKFIRDTKAKEIVSKLNVSHKDPSQAKSIVKKILHSLSCGKYKVLTKDPKSKSITTNDKFKVNSKFKTLLIFIVQYLVIK